jgi:hypothetical protein
LATGYGTPDDESDDVYAIANDDYDGSTTYYTFTDNSIEELNTKADLLVRPVNTATETYSDSI